MKRKDLEVGKTYLVEDRDGKQEAVVISLDGEAIDSARREVGEYRWSSRGGKGKVVVAVRHFIEKDGEVSLRKRVWYQNDLPEQWHVKTVTLGQVKEPFDMDEYRQMVAQRYARWKAERKDAEARADIRHTKLTELVEAANAVLGYEAFSVQDYRPSFGSVPSWTVKLAGYDRRQEERLAEALVEMAQEAKV